MSKYKLPAILAAKAKDQYSSPVTIGFLGDSVTHGCFDSPTGEEGGIYGVYDFKQNYPTKLRDLILALFPSVNVNIINAGIGGDTSQKGAERVGSDLLKYSPDLCIVCYGLNDIWGGDEKITDFEENIRRIFAQIKDCGCDGIFMSPNMICNYLDPRFEKDEKWKEVAEFFVKTQNEGVLARYSKAAAKVAKSMGFGVVDCYSKWESLQAMGIDTTKLLTNRLNHPTREMHSLFAYSLFEEIFFGE